RGGSGIARGGRPGRMAGARRSDDAQRVTGATQPILPFGLFVFEGEPLVEPSDPIDDLAADDQKRAGQVLRLSSALPEPPLASRVARKTGVRADSRAGRLREIATEARPEAGRQEKTPPGIRML